MNKITLLVCYRIVTRERELYDDEYTNREEYVTDVFTIEYLEKKSIGDILQKKLEDNLKFNSKLHILSACVI